MRESSNDINEASIRWVAQMDAGPLSAAEQAQFDAWLAGDRRRQGAFLRAQAGWSFMDRSRALHPRDVATAPAPRRRIWAAAAAVLAVFITAGLLLTPRSPRPEVYATIQGEIRRTPLEDGSFAVINTSTKLEVSLARTHREVRLSQGEAWFQVAKDPKRPFRVEAGPVEVRAVGTAFAVERIGATVQVSVTEGKVEIWSKGAGAQRGLKAGERIVFVDGRIVDVGHVGNRLAWREGRIAFAGQTLAEAAAEFNRYNRRKLVIGDPELAAAPLVGWFNLADPDSFARAAATMLDATVTIVGDTIHLDRTRRAARLLVVRQVRAPRHV